MIEVIFAGAKRSVRRGETCSSFTTVLGRSHVDNIFAGAKRSVRRGETCSSFISVLDRSHVDNVLFLLAGMT
jgi:hypothetical protein